MAAVDFTVKIASSAADIKSGIGESFDIHCEEGDVIKIGRASRSEVFLMAPGISWVHAEIRLLPEAEGEGPRVGIRDISSNGTGLQLPGSSLERLPKGEDVVMTDGAMVALPMKLKAAEDQRFFSVHLGTGAANAMDAPQDADAAKLVEADDAPAVADAEVAADAPVVADALVDAAAPQTVDPPVSAAAADAEPGPKRQRKELPRPEQAPVRPAPKASDVVRVPDWGPPSPFLGIPVAVALPPALPPSSAPAAGRPPRAAPGKRKASTTSRSLATSPDLPPALREKIQAGEQAIRGAKEAEERNQWGVAFDCYQRGLAPFMELLPKLGREGPCGIKLRRQISSYLNKAGEVKEKLEKAKKFEKLRQR